VQQVDEQFMAETIKAMAAIAMLMALLGATLILWSVL
jgi:hypothetical protein